MVCATSLRCVLTGPSGVLDACAHLQQHKKRIHMATLRAESEWRASLETHVLTSTAVHAAAEERNDKMGPHAHRYIHKAVDGLVRFVVVLRSGHGLTP